uniref:C2 tensin-type domain-containing protein n=1 Tax=Globisporangium ultimum (strain ATCC 200006 / CBS 805.95 / DAOM BR144) TaxID=431595 RepID=K3X938_GLOUD
MDGAAANGDEAPQRAANKPLLVEKDAFPASLQWIERGSALIRRMNSERIAEDPRLKRLLFPSPVTVEEIDRSHGGVGGERAPCATIHEHSSLFGESDLEDEEKPPPPPIPSVVHNDPKTEKGRAGSVFALTPRESFEEIEADTAEGSAVKQESENTASNAYKVLLWTYRLQASVQSSFQYAIFAKASEDGYFIPICPRVYCIAPMYVNTFNRLFDAHTTNRQWNAATKLLEQLDTLISKRFDTGACIFDCGLFDGVKRLHHKPLVFDEFCDGRISSISYCRGSIPAMHSAFVIASTVAAWLDLKESNVAVLVAPNNDQMSVFATCCSLYCTDALTFPENFAHELLDVYQQHIRGSESWIPKLQRTFSGVEAKNTSYAGGLPRPQARFVTDFCKLLETRDRKLQECADSAALQERKQKLTGVAVTPASQSIYLHQIVLESGSESDASPNGPETNAVALMADQESRPYFVIQSEKGVLFSSLVNGVRNTNLSKGVHTFKVGKTFANCSDFVLKMYHLPYGRQGELIFECRLHSSILLDIVGAGSGESLHVGEQGEATLKLSSGDFDCVSSNYVLPKTFAVRVRFSRDEAVFRPETSALSLGGLNGRSYSDEPLVDAPATSDVSASPPLSSSTSTSAFDGVVRPPPSQRMTQAKPVRYEGPSVVSFLLSEPNVRTAFGDVVLEKIDVIRRVIRNQLDIYLLFHVDVGYGELKVLPLRHLFHYSLPEPVRARMLEMGASERAMNDGVPSPFDSGSNMTFDEEYARWLQHVYDTDFDGANDFDGEFLRDISIVDVQPSVDYRAVSMAIQVVRDPNPTPFRHGRHARARGASFSLINQLPTYIYSALKENDSQATPDFSVGEEIKSLPCFHSYHSECIDSWLCLNKVCPVCQFSVDHVHPSEEQQL